MSARAIGMSNDPDQVRWIIETVPLLIDREQVDCAHGSAYRTGLALSHFHAAMALRTQADELPQVAPILGTRWLVNLTVDCNVVHWKSTIELPH